MLVRLRLWPQIIMNDVFKKLWFSAQSDERALKAKIDALTLVVPYSFQGIFWSEVTYPHLNCTGEIVDAVDKGLEQHEY